MVISPVATFLKLIKEKKRQKELSPRNTQYCIFTVFYLERHGFLKVI